MKEIAAYQKHKLELIQIGDEFLSLFSQARMIPGMADNAFAAWSETCENLNRQLAEEVLRIAVVGPIKSGKSTFANSLLGGDYLKRGAGVVTSFVTKVRKGPELNATLVFKSWDEINADIKQALLFFPDETLRSTADNFDLRRKEDRQTLGDAMRKMNTEHWIADGARNAKLKS